MARPSDEEVFKKDNFHCFYCGLDSRTFQGWKFLQVDHFRPRARGGKDDIENLVTACILCNQMKGASEWASREEAKREIEKWHEMMRHYWEEKVNLNPA